MFLNKFVHNLLPQITFLIEFLFCKFSTFFTTCCLFEKFWLTGIIFQASLKKMFQALSNFSQPNHIFLSFSIPGHVFPVHNENSWGWERYYKRVFIVYARQNFLYDKKNFIFNDFFFNLLTSKPKVFFIFQHPSKIHPLQLHQQKFQSPCWSIFQIPFSYSMKIRRRLSSRYHLSIFQW